MWLLRSFRVRGIKYLIPIHLNGNYEKQTWTGNLSSCEKNIRFLIFQLFNVESI